MNSNCKVLIVDDREENLIALEAILEELKVDILKARSGNEALGLMLENNVAMVLLDVQMPEMDGFEVVELMKTSERTKYIPVIFITAISYEDRYQFRAYDVGAVDFILKPIIPEILVSKVNVFIQLHEQKEKIIQQTIALEEANRKLRNLSYLDGLTHIPNRRNLDIYLLETWKKSINEEKQLSVILLDIDFFKKYNDYYGHIKGDECLIKVAESFVKTINGSDYFVFRYGGEEFVVVMPDTDKLEAEQFARQLCQDVLKMQIEHKGSTINEYVTISAGVASTLPKNNQTPEHLIHKADMALYKAKECGRACVVVE